jgi:hypothetical protein
VEVRTVPAAVVTKLDKEVSEEATRRSAPPSESAPHTPRFRVVTRKPLPPQSLRRANPVRRTLFFAAVPAVCLLAYVLFWTMAIRGGYVRDQLRREIEDMRIEQAELRAAKLTSQAPGTIFASATALGMKPAEDKQYTRAKR